MPFSRERQNTEIHARLCARGSISCPKTDLPRKNPRAFSNHANRLSTATEENDVAPILAVAGAET
jgi:hypothetical protein